MIQKAIVRRPALAMNGALFVFVTWTNHSLKTPDTIATILFIVVMIPNMLLKLVPAWSIRRL
jgi:membrane protein insertase Oxa1/YidC/SpoIIIJ